MPHFIATLENGSQIPSSLKRVLVPVDFSDASEAALRYAVTVARQGGASVDVLHVWWLPSYVGAGVVGAEVSGEAADESAATFVHDRATAQLDALLGPLRGVAGVQLRGHVASGDPAQVISELSKTYDLIVMGRKERDGVAQIVLGSVATRVLADAQCAVLTVRETPEEPARDRTRDSASA